MNKERAISDLKDAYATVAKLLTDPPYFEFMLLVEALEDAPEAGPEDEE